MRIEDIPEKVFELISEEFCKGEEKRIECNIYAGGVKNFRLRQLGNNVLFCEILNNGYTSVGIWPQIKVEDIYEGIDWEYLTRNPILGISNYWDYNYSPRKSLLAYWISEQFKLGDDLTRIVFKLLSLADNFVRENKTI